MIQLSRRNFIRLSTAGALGGSLGLGSLMTLFGSVLPKQAGAKPGGHLVLSHHCLATFAFEEEFQDIFGKEPIQLYLGGSGYASFTNLQDYVTYDIQEIFKKQTVAMEWEINHCYAGNMPTWGTVAAIGQVKKNSDNRSYIIFTSKQKEALFPAIAVNLLYFELDFPNLDTQIFNTEPIIFRGEVRNIEQEKDVLKDQRVTRRMAGLSPQIKEMDFSKEFEPIGQHNLQSPVKFFLKSNPKKHVATLIKAQLETQVHYGCQIELAACSINSNNVDATFRIKNITDQPQRYSWYVGDSYDLTIFNVRSDAQLNNQKDMKTGRVSLEPDAYVDVIVQAFNNNPEKALGEKACLFCGAHNTPKQLNAFNTDFASGFIVVEGSDFRRVAKGG